VVVVTNSLALLVLSSIVLPKYKVTQVLFLLVFPSLVCLKWVEKNYDGLVQYWRRSSWHFSRMKISILFG
jgi:hypothetical protein